MAGTNYSGSHRVIRKGRYIEVRKGQSPEGKGRWDNVS